MRSQKVRDGPMDALSNLFHIVQSLRENLGEDSDRKEVASAAAQNTVTSSALAAFCCKSVLETRKGCILNEHPNSKEQANGRTYMSSSTGLPKGLLFHRWQNSFHPILSSART